MPPAVARGYAAAATNAGLSATMDIFQPENTTDWILLSPGNLNFNNLHNFASRFLHELAVIGKALTTSYYGRPPKKSYWNGCSTGGRQGLKLAQEYPEDFDGILASAPAVYLEKLGLAEYWPQVVMKELRQWPKGCELDGLTRLAVKACDELDGVKDGIISNPDACHFDSRTVVGKAIDCPGIDNGTVKISFAAAEVADARWGGVRDVDGTNMWPGLNYEANLTALAGTVCGTTTDSIASTTTTATTRNASESQCTAVSGGPAGAWLKYVVLQDPSIDLSEQVTHERFAEMFHLSTQAVYAILSNSSPDLSLSKAAGWENDHLAWIGGRAHLPRWYEGVLSIRSEVFPSEGKKGHLSTTEIPVSTLESVRSFYRYYEAPGVAHCLGGRGPYPGSVFDSAGTLDDLVAWVEEGTPPNTLTGVSNPDPHKKKRKIDRPICMFPLVAKWMGNSGNNTSDWEDKNGWECVQNF